MMTRLRPALAGLLVTLAALGACRRADEQAAVTIVTTPDLAGSGLVESLAQTFTTASKVRTHLLVTEERLIPALVRDGVADVVFTRSPEVQQEIGRAAPIRLRHTIAYNDYLLVGPESDRARAKGARTAAEALRRIARRDRAFCSPTDVPDLRYREELLWRESPAEPSDDRRYRICRGTAMEVLQEASRRSAYTLTDRATFETAGSMVDLVPILERTPLLHNHVDLLLPRPGRRHRNAEWFVQWAMSFRGREVVERVRYDGGRRFFVGER